MPATAAGASQGQGLADSPEAEAAQQAADNGDSVEVLARRTETSQVFANPDGTFTEDRYAVAQWTRQNGAFVDIDTRLHREPDGALRPQATSVGMRFGGGGDRTLASITRDGRTLTFTWPMPLPSPTIADDTATYPDVLPDVDLKLRAGATGFAQLLVIKSPEAASDPALKTLTYALESDGVSLQADEHGNMSALNPTGQLVFTAPTPRMWDSTTTSNPVVARTAQEAGTAADTSEFEPPHGANEAAMPVSIDGDNLRLHPDQDLLNGEKTQYPVYIDPYVDGSRYSWTIAYKKYPNSSFFNGAGWGGSGKTTNEARAGYEDETNGLARSYFRMNTKNLWNTDKQVTKSTFRIKNTWSWSCTKRKVNLWRTAVIGASTTWNKRPTRREKMDDVTDAKGWGSGCPGGNLAFDITKGAKDAASSKWNTITLELSADNESDVYGWKKFDAKSAVMSTTYNTPPSAPTGLDTIPSTKNSKGCGDTAPYGLIGNTDVTLTAKVSDKDGGTVTARFHLWATGHHDDKAKVFFDQTVSVTSGTIAKVKVPKATLSKYLNDANGNFSWKAQASDATAKSDWTPTLGAAGCRFVFDPNRPSTPPTVTSKDFPDSSDGVPTTTGRVRAPGTFTIASGGVKDVAKYQYWTDSDTTKHALTPSAAGGSVSAKLTPTAAGTHTLYAQSIDKAGNVSDAATYIFFVLGLEQADQPGDINGDGNPDLWAIDKDEVLHRMYGAGDGTVADVANEASHSNWKGVRVTHRGDWTGDGYEDLIAARHDDTADADRLWIHPNNGYGFACTDCTEEDGGARQELTVYEDSNNHWQNADQILAIGDVDGALDYDGDGTPDTPGHPDLLVKQGEQLWLYYATEDNRLDTEHDPVLLGDNAWASMDLFAPGDTDGDGHVDLGARDRSTGDVYIYPGTDDDGLPDLAHGVKMTTTLTTTANPLLTSPGDADHSGAFDLWYTQVGASGTKLIGHRDPATGKATKVDMPADFAPFRAIS
ncbi:FG-GAP-like repeat-containing protein [Streptomyces sp. Tu6071]|uniref:FG-GAP-like repeat-containing protein n=1 Tax=Streptomyces sp. Tu6071 TaxID=355249 RepID=UPI001F1DF164|nr:FG-GAP-like repeat-containing protein [Streptomyces sp. Tu6071]